MRLVVCCELFVFGWFVVWCLTMDVFVGVDFIVFPVFECFLWVGII